MIIGIVKERPDWEHRVAMIPAVAAQLCADGHTVYFENGAGFKAGYADEAYSQAGAKPLRKAGDVYKKAELMLKIRAPQKDEYAFLQPEQWIAADFESLKNNEACKLRQKYKIRPVALERLPRLSRVQDIDILSSQNNLAGYKAALTAMNMLNQSVPLLMTAAGTLLPVKALVIGVGVAGLQAIATLQRAGAQVWASDIRPETEEQVISLGAKFISGAPESVNKQLQVSSVLITTAFSPSGVVPRLITAAQLALMPAGAVAIDMAGGNIEGAENGKVLQINGVTLLTRTYLAADVAASASLLYARNMYNLVHRWDELANDEEIAPHIFLDKCDAQQEK